jgi:putative heme iron utilization protein
MTETATPFDHDVAPGQAPPAPATPLVPPAEPPLWRSAAEQARTVVAGSTLGTLATLTPDGDPWASLAAYGLLDDGSPVLCVSTLAEHGRNLLVDPRASICVIGPEDGGGLLDRPRVTLAGVAVQPGGAEAEQARAAHVAAVPEARIYVDYGDFSLWVLRVRRVRWVGGFGRMDWADAEGYAAAEADPVAPYASGAADHLNDDHADALLAIAQALAGYPDATAARCRRIDRYGLDLLVVTPRGGADVRVSFAARVESADGLRAATVELAHRARQRTGA